MREYRNFDLFTATIQSLFLSIIIITTWGLVNYFSEYFFPHYHFSEHIKQLLTVEEYNNVLNGSWLIFGFLTFLSTVVIFSIIFFVWEWLSLTHLFVINVLGFKNKTKNLTPWEDLFTLSLGKYAFIRTKDKFSYMGKINYVSHHPFERELILSEHEHYPLTIINDSGVEVKFSETINHAYINAKEVDSVYIIDTGVKIDKLKPSADNSGIRNLIITLTNVLTDLIKKAPVFLTLLSSLVFAISMYIGTFTLASIFACERTFDFIDIFLLVLPFILFFTTVRLARFGYYKYSNLI
ncbi:MAG: hypothetical protein ABUK01_11325 [Leptospirales bacterium]